MHSSPVWMDARPLCVSGVCRMMFACDTLCTVQFHTLTYRIFFSPCYWPSAPVEGGRIETQALVMNGLRSPLNGGVSKLKPYLFCDPRQMGAAAPRTPRRGLVRVFRAILYITIYILCYIFGGGCRPPELSGRGWYFNGHFVYLIYHFSLFPLGALSNSLRVSRCISAWSQARRTVSALNGPEAFIIHRHIVWRTF